MKKYEILYRDEDFCVIHKRAGLAVQSARASVPDLMSMLRNDLLEEGMKNPYLGLVNRLDQPVEGILLVAFNEKAAADLSRQVADHIHMEKWYQALVCGKPSAVSIWIRHIVPSESSASTYVVPSVFFGVSSVPVVSTMFSGFPLLLKISAVRVVPSLTTSGPVSHSIV